jgi:hypothetical protein
MTRPTETGQRTADLGLRGPPRPAAPPAESAAPTRPIVPPPATRKFNLTTAQVSAAAAASVTSAVGASFLGAGGTIVGAAVGSVITTVAGAVYTRSLESAQDKLRETTVLVKRLPSNGSERPGAVPAHLVDVGDPPVTPGGADLETTVAVPAEADPRPEADPEADPETEPDPETEADAEPEPAAPAAATPRRRVLMFTGIAAAGFSLALFGISAAESLLGHPVSGGGDGTSVGRVIGTDAEPAQEEDQTPATPTAEPSDSESAAPTEQPSGEPTAEPTQEPTSEPTAEPSQEPTSEPSQAAADGAATP